MLPSASVLNSNILALAPSSVKETAIMIFVNTVCDYIDQVQGGPTGAPGIFAMNRMVMYNIFVTQVPVADDSWRETFAEAFYQGAAQGTITPGTVVNPAWLGGSIVDILTAPSGSVTITTLSSAKALLKSELSLATFDNNPALPFATAIMDATLDFIFLTIGLNSSLIPTPIPTPAL